MRILFIVLTVSGGALLLGLIVLLLFAGIKINIRWKKKKKGRTIPIEKCIPENIYSLTAFVTLFGVLGLLIDMTGLPFYIAIPIDITLCMTVNLFCSHIILPHLKNFHYGKLPDLDMLTGITAICVDDIDGEGYGQVKFRYSGRVFIKDCISANHTDLKKGEKVDIVTGEDDLLFVQKKDEIYEILKEEE